MERERGENRLPAKPIARCRAGSAVWCLAKSTVKPCSSSKSPVGVSLHIRPGPPSSGRRPGGHPGLLPGPICGQGPPSMLAQTAQEALIAARAVAPGAQLLPLAAEGAWPWEGGQHLGLLPLALGPVASLPTPPTLNHCSVL